MSVLDLGYRNKVVGLLRYHIEETARLDAMNAGERAQSDAEAGIAGYTRDRSLRYRNETNAMLSLLRVAGLYDEVNLEYWIRYGVTLEGGFDLPGKDEQ